MATTTAKKPAPKADKTKTNGNAALNGAGKTKARAFQNFIAGKWQDSLSGKTFESRNPADTRDLIGTFPLSDKRDLELAVKSAKKAFEWWRKVPAPERGRYFFRLADLMIQRKEEVSHAMTREMGKPIAEMRGDMQEAIDTAKYAVGECVRMFGHTVPSELPNKFNMTIRFPIGVCGLITPWNFPMAIPTWKSFPALACGNTIILKPAELTAACATYLIEIMLEAGFPPETINLLHGEGRNIGAAMVEHPDIPVISFTGSSEVGRIINAKAGAMLKRVSLELGGKNAQIVLNDADIDAAVNAAIWGGFGTTGQRCTATSRVIVEEGVHDEFVKKFTAAAKKLRMGYGNDAGVDMGPLVEESAVEKTLSYVEIGKKEGAKLVTGGKRETSEACANGFFVQPTTFIDVKPNMRIAQEEIFGPVVAIIKCKNFDEAIKICNGIEYGLSSAVFTNDVNKAFIAFRDIEAGLTYINAATIGAEAHMPFGGMKATGNGHREGGWEPYHFYSETKACYVDYSGKLQRAQMDVHD